MNENYFEIIAPMDAVKIDRGTNPNELIQEMDTKSEKRQTRGRRHLQKKAHEKKDIIAKLDKN